MQAAALAAAQAAAFYYRLVAFDQLDLFERLVRVSSISLARRQRSFPCDIRNSIDAASRVVRGIMIRSDKPFQALEKPKTTDLERDC